MSLWTESKMVIKSVTPLRSDPREIKDDRVQVVVEMDIRYYNQFRAQVEAPDALRDRRLGDRPNETPIQTC